MLVAGAVAAALTTAAASARPSEAELIRPGIGIGGIRVGMSLAAVRRALGREEVVNVDRRRGFGTRYVELAWEYGWWRVGFLVRGGRYRVVLVATQHRSERTRGRLGVGTSKAALRRALPVRCDRRWHPGEWCVLRHPNGRRTVFVVFYVCLDRADMPGRPCDRAREEVGEVVVREPF
ncbi:MAG: hypothetical protein M3321_12105 [Actinomycetota bacterium]|nr:hypothetical protein [Actinomycetota bacterium]